MAFGKGVTKDNLYAFSTKRFKHPENAVEAYFKRPYRNSCKQDDIFGTLLHELVNRENGVVGRLSGWKKGGSLYSSDHYSEPEAVVAQNDRSELDDDEEQSPHPRGPGGRSQSLKRAMEQLGDRKGKARAIEQVAGEKEKGRARAIKEFAEPESKGRPTELRTYREGQGKATEQCAKQSPPFPARATRSTALNNPKEKPIELKRMSTLRRNARAGTPISTSGPSSSSARRKKGDSLSDQSSGEEGSKAINEEHTNDEETGCGASSLIYHHTEFIKTLGDYENKGYRSKRVWWNEIQAALKEYYRSLGSGSESSESGSEN